MWHSVWPDAGWVNGEHAIHRVTHAQNLEIVLQIAQVTDVIFKPALEIYNKKF